MSHEHLQVVTLVILLDTNQHKLVFPLALDNVLIR